MISQYFVCVGNSNAFGPFLILFKRDHRLIEENVFWDAVAHISPAERLPVIFDRLIHQVIQLFVVGGHYGPISPKRASPFKREGLSKF